MKIKLIILSLLVVVLLVGCTQSNQEVSEDEKDSEIVSSEIEYSELEEKTENPINFTILDLSCKKGEYGWSYIKGRIKNNDVSRTAGYVKVSIDLYNVDEWIESGETFVRNTDIPAGRYESFEYTFTDDSLIWTRCETFITYNEELSY